MDELTQRRQEEKGKERSTRNDPKGKGKLMAGSYLAKEDDAYMGGEEELIYRTNSFESLFRRFECYANC
jgi:hypothetical protein